MVKLIPNIIRSTRPRQVLKNLSLYAALIFSGQLFILERFWLVTWGVFLFSLTTAATYIINDIVDREADRRHPIKKNRPIAKGDLPLPLAGLTAFTFIFLSLTLSYTSLPFFFFLSMLAYLGIQVLYNLFLKSAIVIDILTIAAGFILRVYAGAFIINAHLSVWFLLCLISAALFLAAAKRRAELAIVESTGPTRKTLSLYTAPLLDSYVAMFATSAWLSWALFTFFESPPLTTSTWLFLAQISKAITINKLLMLTIPLAIFGVMRYLRLIYEGSRTESPEKILLSDLPLLLVFSLWSLLVVGILYGFHY